MGPVTRVYAAVWHCLTVLTPYHVLTTAVKHQVQMAVGGAAVVIILVMDKLRAMAVVEGILMIMVGVVVIVMVCVPPLPPVLPIVNGFWTTVDALSVSAPSPHPLHALP